MSICGFPQIHIHHYLDVHVYIYENTCIIIILHIDELYIAGRNPLIPLLLSTCPRVHPFYRTSLLLNLLYRIRHFIYRVCGIFRISCLPTCMYPILMPCDI